MKCFFKNSPVQPLLKSFANAAAASDQVMVKLDGGSMKKCEDNEDFDHDAYTAFVATQNKTSTGDHEHFIARHTACHSPWHIGRKHSLLNV
jgi:hypothetical protein